MSTETELSVAKSAQLLATTPTRILMLLKNGALKGREVDGEWLVEADSLACCREHGSDLKTTQGCASHCNSGGCGCR